VILIGMRRLFRAIRHIPVFLYESFTYQCESCRVCGRCFRVRWSVRDDIWQKVMNVNDCGGGSLCLDCFIKRAEKVNVLMNTSKEIEYAEPFYPQWK